MPLLPLSRDKLIPMAISMNFASELDLPADIWKDIFHVMDAEFTSLKYCSTLNQAFRSMLTPRIFASACIMTPISLADFQRWISLVAPVVKHLTIRPFYHLGPRDVAQWENPVYKNLLKKHCGHLQEITLMRQNYKSFDDLYDFLKNFSALSKLSLYEVDVDSYPSHDYPDTTTTPPPEVIDSALRLDELELDGGSNNTILPYIRNFLCLPFGAGFHLKRLSFTSLRSPKFEVIVLMDWLNDSCACRITHLNLHVGRMGDYEGAMERMCFSYEKLVLL
jgi:hypothetical protein